MNKQGRGSGTPQKERSIWEEARAQELIQRVLNKELSLTAAAVRLGVDTNTFFAHLTDNGKNKGRVALLLGTDGTTTPTTTAPTTTTASDTTVAATASYVNANTNHSEDSANASSVDPAGEDSNPSGNNVGGGQGSDDSNAESLPDNMEVEVNGEKGDNEESEMIDSTRQMRSTMDLQEANTGEDPQEASPHNMETFQSIVEDDGNVYADAS